MRAPTSASRSTADTRPYKLDTRNNHGFRVATGRRSRDRREPCYLMGPIGRFSVWSLGISVLAADFMRAYPVAARRSWKIRRSKL
jgi:hypothetical protein